ncbi:hypothetical protein [Phycicoccus elongatus]|uniref:hypothetical protein n=1 Tax=Phycicoccus elongatus TaxID=101689 RepID=UPI0037850B0A
MDRIVKPPIGRWEGHGERLNRYLRGHAHVLVTATIGLLALGCVAWFMISTAPRDTPEKTATMGVRLAAPTDSVSGLTVVANTSLPADGGANVDVNSSFM